MLDRSIGFSDGLSVHSHKWEIHWLSRFSYFRGLATLDVGQVYGYRHIDFARALLVEVNGTETMAETERGRSGYCGLDDDSRWDRKRILI